MLELPEQILSDGEDGIAQVSAADDSKGDDF